MHFRSKYFFLKSFTHSLIPRACLVQRHMHVLCELPDSVPWKQSLYIEYSFLAFAASESPPSYRGVLNQFSGHLCHLLSDAMPFFWKATLCIYRVWQEHRFLVAQSSLIRRNGSKQLTISLSCFCFCFLLPCQKGKVQFF